jgi:hypothetical protein
VSATYRPGTYHRAEELENGNMVVLGANGDTGCVVGAKEVADDEVLLVLTVPAGTLFRLT